MRIRPRWFFFLILIFLAPSLLSAFWSRVTRHEIPTPIPERLRKQSDKSIVTVLAMAEWITVEIPHGTNRLRLLTNACLEEQSLPGLLHGPDSAASAAKRGAAPGQRAKTQLETSSPDARPHFAPDAASPEPPEWHYALEYVFLGDDGESIDGGKYHFITRIGTYRDPETGQAFLARYFSEAPLFPTQTREMSVSTATMPKTPKRLRIRLHQSDPEVVDVVLRVLCRVPRPHAERSYQWNRLSKRRRKQLAAGSVHRYVLLSSKEKQNLLRTISRPVAPMGYQKVDYQQRVLFTLRDVQQYRVREEPRPSNAEWTIGPRRHGMMPIPEGAGRLRLEFAPSIQRKTSSAKPPVSDVSQAPESGTQLRLKWYGRRPSDRFEEAVSVGPDDGIWETHIEGGLLELDADAPLTLRATWNAREGHGTPDTATSSQAEPLDITPKPAFLRTYVASPNRVVEYAIVHLQGHPTTVRLSLRCVLRPRPGESAIAEAPGQRHEPAAMTWESLDEAGQRVQTGTLAVDRVASLYDRIATESPEGRVSEPADHYLALGASVRRLRICAPGEAVLVGAATRVTDLPKVTAVPEDYAEFRHDKRQNRAWFPVRPLAWRERIEVGQSVLLLVQRRPPQTDPDLAAGRYAWESFQPRGPWRARHVLLPREPGTPLRRQAVANTLVELTANHRHTLRLVSDSGHQSVSPTLVYRFKEEPGGLEVYVDDQLHLEYTPSARTGQVLLPGVLNPMEPHTVSVRCEASVRVWLNRVEPAGQPLWRRQLAIRYDDSALEFDYPKVSADCENLVIHLFRNNPSEQRLQLRVTIADPSGRSARAASTEHTIRSRLFDVAPAAGHGTWLLDGGGLQTLDAGRSCIVPFGSDLGPGKYTVRVERDNPTATDPAELYVVVYRTTAGTDQRQQLSIETVPIKP